MFLGLWNESYLVNITTGILIAFTYYPYRRIFMTVFNLSLSKR